jgi:hypothetical protein
MAPMPSRRTEEITIDTWLMQGAAGLSDFPQYIRGIPDILFDAMDLDR